MRNVIKLVLINFGINFIFDIQSSAKNLQQMGKYFIEISKKILCEINSASLIIKENYFDICHVTTVIAAELK